MLRITRLFLVVATAALTAAAGTTAAAVDGASASPAALVAWIFGPERPGPDRTGIACGLELEAMVSAAWPQLSPELRAAIPDPYRPAAERSGDTEKAGLDVCDAFIDTPHFRVHYSTQLAYQPPGYPDLKVVRDVGAYLEAAYAYHRDVSGMGVALPDGAGGGGMNLVDCYFYPREGTSSAHPVDLAAGSCPVSRWGYFTLASDMVGTNYDDDLRAISEHEYFHLLQYAHGMSDSTWFSESTARASEFLVWPAEASPRGFGYWALHTWYPIWDATGLQSYAPHFWFFLMAKLDLHIMTGIWDRMCHSNMEAAIRAELAARGTDLEAVTSEFATWNYFTGDRDDGHHYNPLFGLKSINLTDAFATLPVPPRRPSWARYARPGGANYIGFSGRATRGDLRISFDGTPELSSQRVVTVVAANAHGHREWTLTPDADGDADFRVPDWDLYDEVALVVANFWDAPTDSALLDFEFSAEEIDAEPASPTPAELVKALPNPFTDATEVQFLVPDEGARASVRVYDAAGRRVRTLDDPRGYAGLRRVAWDGRDDGGKRMAAGPYLIRFEAGGHMQSRKVMLVD